MARSTTQAKRSDSSRPKDSSRQHVYSAQTDRWSGTSFMSVVTFWLGTAAEQGRESYVNLTIRSELR
jgi:hypothetical protein